MGEPGAGPDRLLPAETHVTWDCDGAVKIRYGADDEENYPPSVPTSVVSWFRKCCSDGGERAAYAIKDSATGMWKETTYAEYYEETINVSREDKFFKFCYLYYDRPSDINICHLIFSGCSSFHQHRTGAIPLRGDIWLQRAGVVSKRLGGNSIRRLLLRALPDQQRGHKRLHHERLQGRNSRRRGRCNIEENAPGRICLEFSSESDNLHIRNAIISDHRQNPDAEEDHPIQRRAVSPRRPQLEGGRLPRIVQREE